MRETPAYDDKCGTCERWSGHPPASWCTNSFGHTDTNRVPVFNNSAGCSACEKGRCPGRGEIPHPFKDHPDACPICGEQDYWDLDNEDVHWKCGTAYNCEGAGYMKFCDRPGGFDN